MRGARNRDGEKKLVGSQMKHSKRQDVSLVAAARGGGPCWSFPDKLRSHEEQKIFFISFRNGQYLCVRIMINGCHSSQMALLTSATIF